MQTKTLNFEIKSLGAREFEGYGSVFGNVDLGGDVVLPGAFKRSLVRRKQSGDMPLMYWMHKSDHVPGVWKEMDEHKDGLYVRGELADTQLGNETRTLLQMKAVRGLSIGYETKDADYDKDGNRLLKELELWEVSIVSQAMNPLAKVEAVKARLSADGEYIPTEREFEQFLRQAGYSKNVSRSLVAKLFDSDPGGMPDGRRWDAGNVEPEVNEALSAILKLTDRVGAASLRR